MLLDMGVRDENIDLRAKVEREGRGKDHARIPILIRTWRSSGGEEARDRLGGRNPRLGGDVGYCSLPRTWSMEERTSKRSPAMMIGRATKKIQSVGKGE